MIVKGKVFNTVLSKLTFLTKELLCTNSKISLRDSHILNTVNLAKIGNNHL